jgi:SAM-dependent methyltransferase
MNSGPQSPPLVAADGASAGTARLYAQLAQRYSDYLRANIATEIAPCDDMFAGNITHYMSVGGSAIDICAQAMILARRNRFNSVLDLPCGGGRVTRHLKAFFPEARLYAADINPAKQAFVVRTFGAEPVEVAADFSSAPRERFDLIFVGSLVTHFNDRDIDRALRWFIGSLAPMGVLIVTTHGRRSALNSPTQEPPGRTIKKYQRSGFGFFRTHKETANGIAVEYGGSYTKPSWLMRLVEDNSTIRLLGFQESVWDNNHDVLILHRNPIE